MVVFSIGEIIYSPRIWDYCMELAPHGREGLYSSISTIPNFAVKLFAGGLAGEMLEAYVPEEGDHHGRAMWFILACISVSSPAILLLVSPCYNAVSTTEDQDDERLLLHNPKANPEYIVMDATESEVLDDDDLEDQSG